MLVFLEFVLLFEICATDNPTYQCENDFEPFDFGGTQRCIKRLNGSYKHAAAVSE